jgi:hypothetical protein
MKNMMLRLAIASATILTATVMTSNSYAQAAPASGEVDFNGVVPGQCSFSNPVNGSIAMRNDGTQTLGSNPDWNRGASTGHIDLTCSAAATLTVADPVQVSGPTVTDKNVAVVYTSAGNLNSSKGTFAPKSVALAAGFTQTGMNVDVDNSSSTKILGGTYAYKVIVTATTN